MRLAPADPACGPLPTSEKSKYSRFLSGPPSTRFGHVPSQLDLARRAVHTLFAEVTVLDTHIHKTCGGFR